MIEFEHVGKTYKTLTGRAVRAVDDFTLAVAPGEVLGIAGPNGAGKSTLLALLLGFLRPTDGAVRIAGDEPRHFIERHGIGYLSELIVITPRWRADDALARYATLAGVPGPDVRPRVDAVIDLLGIAEHRGKKVKALSKGNLQRLGLAQALLRDERVVVLDEPTHGLDPVWTQRFRDIVVALRAPERAIIIASHNLDELQRLADRVAIIDRGRLQRVVDVAGAARAPGGATVYRIAVASDPSVLPLVFPEAVAVAPSTFDVSVADLEALNRGLAALLARGGIVSSVAPARSALEQQFREAIGAGP